MWRRPRQEAKLIMRIAAAAAFRPSGVGPRTQPAGAAEATARAPHDAAGHPERQSGKTRA
jgi:hypothetical protein